MVQKSYKGAGVTGSQFLELQRAHNIMYKPKDIPGISFVHDENKEWLPATRKGKEFSGPCVSLADVKR